VALSDERAKEAEKAVRMAIVVVAVGPGTTRPAAAPAGTVSVF
jgi:hypothetical protein